MQDNAEITVAVDPSHEVVVYHPLSESRMLISYLSIVAYPLLGADHVIVTPPVVESIEVETPVT